MPIADSLSSFCLLLLLGIANGAPILAQRLLAERFDTPLDGGRLLRDGRPVLGPSKTIRGVVVAVACASVAAPLLGMTWMTGASLATASMAGDLISSFIKRRLGLPPHARAFGLDQIPEALLPLLLLQSSLGLSIWQIAVVLVSFVALEAPVSRLLFRLGIRDRPY